MAEFTLDKFGVPIEGGRQGPILMPKRNYLFRARFLNFGAQGNQAQPVTLQAQTATYPQMSQEAVEINAYNSKAYYAGKHTWNEVELTVRDDVTNSVVRNIDAQIQRQMDHYNQTAYRAATDYKFTYLLEMMDGGNDAVLDTWTMEGCFITNYSSTTSGDYSDSQPKMISISIRYDNATHTDEAGNRLMTTPAEDPRGRNL